MAPLNPAPASADGGRGQGPPDDGPADTGGNEEGDTGAGAAPPLEGLWGRTYGILTCPQSYVRSTSKPYQDGGGLASRPGRGCYHSGVVDWTACPST